MEIPIEQTVSQPTKKQIVVAQAIATFLGMVEKGEISLPGAGIPDGSYVCTVNKLEIATSRDQTTKYGRLICDLRDQATGKTFENRRVNVNYDCTESLKGLQGVEFKMVVTPGTPYKNYKFSAVTD